MKHCLEKFITNCDKGLLQIATDTSKLRQVLLQIATGITNCDNRYYKLRQVLQIATVHTRIVQLAMNFVTQWI